MNSKEKFISEIEDILLIPGVKLSEDAEKFFEEMKKSTDTEIMNLM